MASGELEAVKLLAEKGQHPHNWPVWDCYTFRSTKRVARYGYFLLDHGAGVNVKAGIYSTVLQVASLGGRAEVNAKGGRFGTLAAASVTGYSEVARLY